MNKIIAKWNNETNTVPADNRIEKWAKGIIDGFNNNKTISTKIIFSFDISSFTQVNALRLAVTREQIKPQELEFLYGDNTIYVDKTGRLSEWPEDFANLCDKQLEELLK